MTIYSCNFANGNQTLIDAPSEVDAEHYADRYFGRMMGPYQVEKASKDDIAWVQSMGGIIHKFEVLTK